MVDERTLSYINVFAIFCALTELCKLDDQAKEIVGNKKITMEISVKDGPVGRLVFMDGQCQIYEGAGKCDIRLPFSSPKKFNGIIDSIQKKLNGASNELDQLIGVRTRAIDRSLRNVTAVNEGAKLLEFSDEESIKNY